MAFCCGWNCSIFKRGALDKRNRRPKGKVFSGGDEEEIGIWLGQLAKSAKRRLIGIIEETQRRGGQEELAEDLEYNRLVCEKVSVYQFYGSILRDSDDSQMVQEHLLGILSLAHRGPLEAKGIASALGLVAQRHLQDVLQVMENFSEKVLENKENGSQSLLWSMLLFCYGQVALSIGEEVLPITDKILSKMMSIVRANPLDKDVKKNFLVALLMLVDAIVATGKAERFQLVMKGPLVECLVLMGPWLESEVDRERVLESVAMLLKFLASHLNLNLSAEFGQLAYLTVMMLALAADPAENICTSAVQAFSCLYKLFSREKGQRKRTMGLSFWKRSRSNDLWGAKPCPPNLFRSAGGVKFY